LLSGSVERLAKVRERDKRFIFNRGENHSPVGSDRSPDLEIFVGD
jgi:hypothetical protein